MNCKMNTTKKINFPWRYFRTWRTLMKSSRNIYSYLSCLLCASLSPVYSFWLWYPLGLRMRLCHDMTRVDECLLLSITFIIIHCTNRLSHPQIPPCLEAFPCWRGCLFPSLILIPPSLITTLNTWDRSSLDWFFEEGIWKFGGWRHRWIQIHLLTHREHSTDL